MNSSPEKVRIEQERYKILRRLENWLEMPMLVLGFVWLGLLIAEFIWGLSPFLEWLGLAIWGIFILDFLLKFTLAPAKFEYIKSNWLTLLALILPALRVFRIIRVLRVLRGVRLVRVVTSVNRSMGALGKTMQRRGFMYVLALTAIVTFAGAAGMLAFENHKGGITDYGTALWWTAMIMTTMGSAYWPETPEGRVLCIVLALYAFAVFGYVTATLASFFVGRDKEIDKEEGNVSLNDLKAEISLLREEVQKAMRRER
jgi:voltage-gated potassium channel